MKKLLGLLMFVGVFVAPLAHAQVYGFLDGNFYDVNGNFKYICFLDNTCLGADNQIYLKDDILGNTTPPPINIPITNPQPIQQQQQPIQQPAVGTATPIITSLDLTLGSNLPTTLTHSNQVLTMFSVNLSGIRAARLSEIDFNIIGDITNFKVVDASGFTLPCSASGKCLFSGYWPLDNSPWNLTVYGDTTNATQVQINVMPIQAQDIHTFGNFTSNSLTGLVLN